MRTTVTQDAKSIINRLKLISRNSDFTTNMVLRIFAQEIADRQITSAEVVLAWRDVAVELMRTSFLTFAQHCEIDAKFELFINTVFQNDPDFAAEVIAQKNMDIRNGETL